VPRTFVFNRSALDGTSMQLVLDMRKVMEPYTAQHLSVRRKNILKDFVNVAGSLKVSHFLMFSRTERGFNLVRRMGGIKGGRKDIRGACFTKGWDAVETFTGGASFVVGVSLGATSV
jgi:hypothetical protein